MSRTAAPPKDRLILLDTREALNHDIMLDDSENARHLLGTLLHEGLSYVHRALDFGDYHLRLRDDAPCLIPWLVVESKTWPDLMASVRESTADRNDSRIRHQVAGLLELKKQGYQVAVMTVGVLTPSGGKRAGVYIQNKGRRQFKQGWNWFEMMSIPTALQHLGIMWIQAPSETQVPHTLRLAAELVERSEHFAPPGLAPFSWLTPKLGQLARTMTAVEGVGRTMAMELASNFKSFSALYEAEVAELRETTGVGKVMAERIHSHFHASEEIVMPQESEE